MITNAAIASNLAPEPSKLPLKTPKDGSQAPGQAAASTPDWNYDSKTSLSYIRTEDLYLKYTSRDGDVLEMRSKTTEAFRYDEQVTISADARALAARACAKDGAKDPDGTAEAEASDPKEKQLKELREWANQVEREVRLQQRNILERMLKRSGKDGDRNGSPFLMVTPDGVCARPPDGARARPGNAEKTEDAQVPDYWNAENTSDRIVHFATQMAEITGMDLKEFGEIIKKAVSKGFDQAGEATGELTGAAAKLNKDTKDLVFSKLSNWLEDHADKPYNLGTQKPAAAGAPVAAKSGAGTATGPE
jgi:hypothetical protein